MKQNYSAFLASKAITDKPTGIETDVQISEHLFPFQRDIVKWALKRGKAALFEDCGLGKTIQQLEWARHVCEHTGGTVLILAPVGVVYQTPKDGAKFGYVVNPCKSQEDVVKGINITNYEKLHHFDAQFFDGVVLDESSILKSFTGKIRTQLINQFSQTRFKLACTATPAPNDFVELGNHSEFLSVMTRTEMLATFFVHDGGDTSKWRLKGHAQTEFWKWLCSWAVNIRRPSDLGYDDGDFKLPPLEIYSHQVESSAQSLGMLFAMPASSLLERRDARRGSLGERVAMAARIANETDDQYLVWCDLNVESDALAGAIRGAVEVTGSDSDDHKEKSMIGFADGSIRVLVSKPSICGMGMNFQRCHREIFVGLSDSFEDYYQAVRRCWRFGQTQKVEAHIITSNLEQAVVENIKRKEREAEIMADQMVENMAEISSSEIKSVTRKKDSYRRAAEVADSWQLHLGDCVDVVSEMESDSVHFSIFSPPFASLYTYSNSDRDMGNCKDEKQFMDQFRFLVAQLHRVTMPGRLLSFHCMNLPTSKSMHGFIGIRDFRGDLIRMFVEAGFIFHSEVCIWKDPVTAMQRTKALGLLYKQVRKDSAMSRQGIPDYLVTMRKPGVNPEPVTHTHEGFPVDLWQRYASPVWMDINPSNTLQKESAREHNDERHICPLQLQVIERAINLWTNPGDLVLSPFAGIGSEGHQALKMGRRFVGAELKESYYKQARLNLMAAQDAHQRDLFASLDCVTA